MPEAATVVPGGWQLTGLDADAATGLEARVPFPLVIEPAAQETAERDRFRGALLGGAIGDALGRPFEGSRRPAGKPPTFYLSNSWRDGRNEGTWTDDTQLTVLVGEALLAGEGMVEPADMSARLLAWLAVGRGLGRATRRAVEILEAGVAWHLAGEPDPHHVRRQLAALRRCSKASSPTSPMLKVAADDVVALGVGFRTTTADDLSSKQSDCGAAAGRAA